MSTLTQTPPQPPVDTLEFDILCHHCNYNLRGLSSASNCPECGEPILASIQHHNGTTLSPDQHRSLTRAGALLAASVWMTTCSLPIAFLLIWTTGDGRFAGFLLAFWILGEHVLWTFGVASLPLPDHPLQKDSKWPTLHRWNKSLAIVDPLCLLLIYSMAFPTDGPTDDIVFLTAFLAAACLFIARGGSVLFTGLWLITIGRYLRFRFLVVQIYILMAAFILINAIWATCSLYYAGASRRNSTETPIAIAAFTAAPTLLFFAPWAALVLTRFARRIQKRPTTLLHAFPVIPAPTL